MAVIVVSDEPLTGIQKFLAEALGEVDVYSTTAAAVVLMKGKKEIETGYWNMTMVDKQVAAGAIQADITDQIIKENFDRYMDMWNEEGEGET